MAKKHKYLLGKFCIFLLLCSQIFTSGVDSGVGFVWSMVYKSLPCFHSWYLSGWNFLTKTSMDIDTMSLLQVHCKTRQVFVSDKYWNIATVCSYKAQNKNPTCTNQFYFNKYFPFSLFLNFQEERISQKTTLSEQMCHSGIP